MSDNLRNHRSISGNFRERPHCGRQGEGNNFSYSFRRSLVEEVVSVDLQYLRQIHGRRIMLRAADEGRAIRVSLDGKSFDVHLTYDIHRLPGRQVQWADPENGNLRLWFVCASCLHRARKLYLSTSAEHPVLACRKCSGLIYMSQLCGRNRWWKLCAKPIRKLLRRSKRLMRREASLKVTEELHNIERMIWLYQQRAAPKSHRGKARGIKRKYRDVDLVFGLR
jgi:hypothetical protein